MHLEIVKTSLRVSAQAKNCPRSPTRLATIAQVRQAAGVRTAWQRAGAARQLPYQESRGLVTPRPPLFKTCV
jgi:hypothetical protein